MQTLIALFLALSLIGLALAVPSTPMLFSNEKTQPDSLFYWLSNHLSANPPAPGSDVPSFVDIPFGNHDHKRGMQVFDKDAAELIVNEFQARKAKDGSNFVGAPIYLGHPDDPIIGKQFPDSRAYGWIPNIEVMPNCLRLHTDWNEPGKQLISNKQVRFTSPAWFVTPIAGRAKAFRPSTFKSLGLTNDPNISMAPLIPNEDDAETCPPWVHAAVGTDPEKDGPEQVKTAISGLKEKASKADEFQKAHSDLKAKQDAAEKAHSDLSEAHSALQAAHKKITGAYANTAVESAISRGTITIGEKKATLELLSNATDFDAELAKLNARKPAISMGTALTLKLGERRSNETALDNRQEQILSNVNERMEKFGESYDTAFSYVRRNKPALFANMREPEMSGK